MNPKLIIALDYDNKRDVDALVDKLDPNLCALKVGSELFTLYGAELVRHLISKRFKIFLDLKFHDIPNTVARACKAAADIGVWMLNVHASGGSLMMNAAVDALSSYQKDRPILIAVTILTSFTRKDLVEVGVNTPLQEHVIELAKLSKDACLDGVVCSAHEVNAIKNVCGSEFICVTPGIRLPTSIKDDQNRVMSPSEAMQIGANYLVVGRPITRAENPNEAVQLILQDMII